MDALAACDLAVRRCKPPPTVRVSSGATVRCFLDHPTVQTLLLHTDSVVVVRDNESTAKRQAETDAAHDFQRARIRELRGTCGDGRPPVGVKDVAELNGREQLGGRGIEIVRALAATKPPEMTGAGTTRWKVSYRLLSSIIEGELGSDTPVIEGQLLGRVVASTASMLCGEGSLKETLPIRDR